MRNENATTLRLALWNVDWAMPNSARGRAVRQILAETDADVICLAEGFAGLLPDCGNTIESDPDYGYELKPGRRKVLLWSRYPWSGVDNVGSPDLPSGRIVRGQVATPLGDVVVFGVCIPWFNAHVSTGRLDRRQWQDHTTYLEALRPILAREATANVLVAGDYNQSIPPKRGSQISRHKLLADALCGFLPCTVGDIPGVEKKSLNHVAHSPSLSPVALSGWSSHGADGTKLSDHFGLLVDFQAVVRNKS